MGMKLSKAMRSTVLKMAGLVERDDASSRFLDKFIAKPIISLPVAESHGNARHVVTITSWLPVRLNALMSMHHMDAHRRKMTDAMIVAGECFQAGFTQAIGPRKLSYTLIYPPGRRRADSDAFDKNIRDSLVLCGVLVDDSPRWLVATVPTYERSLDGPATRIVIEDVPLEKGRGR